MFYMEDYLTVKTGEEIFGTIGMRPNAKNNVRLAGPIPDQGDRDVGTGSGCEVAEARLLAQPRLGGAREGGPQVPWWLGQDSGVCQRRKVASQPRQWVERRSREEGT